MTDGDGRMHPMEELQKSMKLAMAKLEETLSRPNLDIDAAIEIAERLVRSVDGLSETLHGLIDDLQKRKRRPN